MSQSKHLEDSYPVSKFDYQKILNWPFRPLVEKYRRADVIAYARGIGVGMPGPCREGSEVFLTDSEDLQVLPMMAIVLNQGPMWTQDPEAGIDWKQTVHAEEAVTIHQSLPNEGTLVAEYSVDEIYDKGEGKGALMYESRHLSTVEGEPVATVRIGTFLRGNGGCGGATSNAPRPPRVPQDRPADEVIDIATPDRDNKSYQLGEEFLQAVKLELRDSTKPMLRGVCSFGLAGRSVLKLACNDNPARLKHLGLRYIAPVFAEETLRTELWFTERGKAAFRVSSVERSTVVIDNGVAEFIHSKS